MLQTGRFTNEDAWLWPEGDPDFDGLLAEQVGRIVGSGSSGVGELRAAVRAHAAQPWHGEEVRARSQQVASGMRSSAGVEPLCVAVAGRLRQEVHMPAVREALGCLIPEGLHPRLDGRKPKGKYPGGVPERTGVHLTAGSWKVDVFEEQGLAQGRPLPKGTLEFFVICLLYTSDAADE